MQSPSHGFVPVPYRATLMEYGAIRLLRDVPDHRLAAGRPNCIVASMFGADIVIGTQHFPHNLISEDSPATCDARFQMIASSTVRRHRMKETRHD